MFSWISVIRLIRIKNCLLRNTTISGEGPCLSLDLTVDFASFLFPSPGDGEMDEAYNQPWVAKFLTFKIKQNHIIQWIVGKFFFNNELCTFLCTH